MTSFLIVERELRGRARGSATYWTRFGAALTGLLICVPEPVSSGATLAASTTGRPLFHSLVAVAFLLACGSCLLAADAISGERREGTLGLLLLAPVRVFDVVLGKLISQGVAGACALLALSPALMIPLLAGGLTGGEVGRTCLALWATQFFALAAGLCASASERTRWRALTRAVILLLILLILPYYLSFAGGPGSLWRYVGLPSPLILLPAAAEAPYQAAPWHFWLALTGVLSAAVLLLARAGQRLRRAVREEYGACALRRPEPAPERRNALEVCRWEPEKETAGPVEWMIYRQHGVHGATWALAAAAFIFSRWAALAQQPGGVLGLSALWLFSWPLGLGCALFGGMLIAWVASRFFVQVRRTGELELLLVTPVGAATLVADQWKVLRRVFILPILGIQAVTLIPVLATTSSMNAGVPNSLGPASVLAALLNYGNSLLALCVLCRLGLWFGHQARGQTGALARAVSLAVGVPWAFSLAWTLFAGAARPTLVGPMATGGSVWMCELLIMGFYAALWRWSIVRLNEDLTQAGGAASRRWNVAPLRSLGATS